MAATDANGQTFDVGSIVNIPCVVTSIATGVGIPDLVLTTKYPSPAGSTETISTMSADQVVLSK
jgi:hypothetical protein